MPSCNQQANQSSGLAEGSRGQVGQSRLASGALQAGEGALARRPEGRLGQRMQLASQEFLGNQLGRSVTGAALPLHLHPRPGIDNQEIGSRQGTSGLQGLGQGHFQPVCLEGLSQGIQGIQEASLPLRLSLALAERLERLQRQQHPFLLRVQERGSQDNVQRRPFAA